LDATKKWRIFVIVRKTNWLQFWLGLSSLYEFSFIFNWVYRVCYEINFIFNSVYPFCYEIVSFSIESIRSITRSVLFSIQSISSLLWDQFHFQLGLSSLFGISSWLQTDLITNWIWVKLVLKIDVGLIGFFRLWRQY
jgi:hypothetical protein